MSEKPTLNIVLVEPRIPQNTGNVARTCACTACRLHLVGPMGFAIDDKKLKHAGLDYWHYLDISYYDSLDEFFAKTAAPIITSPPRHPSATPTCSTRTVLIWCSGGRMPACRKHCLPPTRSTASGCPCGIPAAA